ncbi:MAG: erythromycin esterase [Sneathiella sp.]|jgi:erythromycin esterase-like protein|uniref:erythromycin esterase family protein n=1 Tax=Sneathiella sp. TaxID=1964365 RepID=UPI000C69A28A|nr:erythromycin esterase family protein [Sneathiella sp.]MAL80828.1 erythromycin esterase [Sneathiella sp.]|tara:strand:+ start:6938 stop:8311 length:1374 start_codon:yes stop_codon:yes gene_type:complete
MIKRQSDYSLIRAIEKHAIPMDGELLDYDEIIQASKGKQFILIGEASHGTKEFYRARAEITERLIAESAFDAVAVEADWPDAYRVNRYVSLLGEDRNADQALADFERFPTWMWRNQEVERFIHWLYEYNFEFRLANGTNDGPDWPVGFYGLDLYSLNTSIHAVIGYLTKIDPAAARRARKRYGCLYHFMNNPPAYGYAIDAGFADSCEDEILLQLKELQEKAFEYLRRDGFIAEDEYFCAQQNAKLVRNAEGYYRALYRGHPNTWNLRDKHMSETLKELATHLTKRLGRKARIVVWAHNSHVGNASATEMFRRGEFNMGQIIKSIYGAEALLVGFSTSRGTVTAASNWDAPIEVKQIREPVAGSLEEIFHRVNLKSFMLDLRETNEAVDGLMEDRLQRAIGVIYRADTERQSHYFYTRLPEQFDFIIHYDNTRAVKPLKTDMRQHKGEMDETFPSGL